MKRLTLLLTVFGLAIGCSNTHGTRPDGAAGAGSADAGAGGASSAGTAGAGAAGSQATDGSAGSATTAAGATGAMPGPDAGEDGDGSTGSLPDFADGARLKALAYVTDGGDKLWRGWHDVQRQEDCTFRLAADGKVRCLPAVDSFYTFADAACTVPLVFRAPCAPPPSPYFATSDASACGGPAAPLHKRLNKILAPAALHVVDATGACVSTVPPPGNVEYWVAATTPEPETAFVAAEEVRDGRDAALMARYFRGEDGSLQLVGPYDRAAGRACAEPAGHPGVCAPDPLSIISAPGGPTSGEFLDAACTVRTVIAFLQCELPGQHPDLVFYPFGGGACAVQTGRFYRLGAPDPDRPFLKNDQSCAQSTSNKVFPASSNRFVLGAEVPASAFPATRTADEGTGRLRVRTLETPDGQHLLQMRLFDNALGATCTPTQVGDAVRCVTDTSADNFFLDAACTHHAYVQDDTGCAAPKFVTVTDAVACDAPEALKLPHYLEVGAVLMPPPTTLFLKVTGGQCAMYPALGPVHDVTERPLGDAPAILVE